MMRLMPKIRTLVVIVLASAMVVPADRYASAQEIVRGIINRGVSPTPGTIPLPPTPPPGLGIDIGTIPWTESNLATLRKADKADVVRLLNGIRTDNSHGIMPPDDVSEFSWVDLAGNGKYALVLVQTPTACRVCTSILLICRQSERRKITMQMLPGTYQLSKAIRDLNGDGKKELIIQPPLDPMVVGGGPIPLVYRLENGKYVEASKDFASY